MKPLQYITALILTIALILVLFATNHPKTNTDTSEINIVCTGLTEPLELTYDEGLLERIEELVRNNEQLEMENKALKSELSAFGGWWKEVEKNDFPKGGEVDVKRKAVTANTG